jgi:hypothetical protein
MTKIYEAQLEDYIEQYPDALLVEKIVARQAALPHGFADLIAFNGDQLFVIELKVVPLQEADVGQVLRYTYDVREAVYDLARQWADNAVGVPPLPPDLRYQMAFLARLRTLLMYDYDPYYIQPVLVGPSIEPKVLAAMHGAGGLVWLWKQKTRGKGFLFEAIQPRSKSLFAQDSGPPSWVRDLWSAIIDQAVTAAQRAVKAEIHKTERKQG